MTPGEFNTVNNLEATIKTQQELINALQAQLQNHIEAAAKQGPKLSDRDASLLKALLCLQFTEEEIGTLFNYTNVNAFGRDIVIKYSHIGLPSKEAFCEFVWPLVENRFIEKFATYFLTE